MATAVISPAINLQVPPEDVTAPNDHHLYDYEPKREETGDELSSAPSPFQNKKAKPFINIDDAYETETIPADAVATNEAPEPETAPNVVQPDEHDEALAGVVAPEGVAGREEAVAANSQVTTGSEALAPAVASNETTAPSVAPTDATSEEAWTDKLSTRIAGLWKTYTKNRIALGSDLMEQKTRLKETKGYGKWSAFLDHAGIPRPSADRLIIGFKRYLDLPSKVRNAAQRGQLDLGKPSFLNAAEEVADAFDLAGTSEVEAAAIVAEIRKVEKESRKGGAPKKVKGKAKKPPTLDKAQVCVSDYLNSLPDGDRADAAESLIKWIEDEYNLTEEDPE